MENQSAIPIANMHPDIALPSSELTIDKPTQTALLLLTARNRKINEVKPDAHLAEQPTYAMVETAKKLVAFQRQLKQHGDATIAGEFLSTPYNLTWLEQIIDIDPKKVALAMQMKHRVHDIMTQEHIDPQFEPALAICAFAGIERLHDLGVQHEPTPKALEAIRVYEAKTDNKSGIHRHLIRYLESLPKDQHVLIGNQRDEMLTEIMVKDIAKRLEHTDKHAAILQQSQGIEVEVLQRLEWAEPENRNTKRLRMQLERVERYGIRDWLPRGIRKEDHERTDWHLTHMLGIPEDVGEKKYEWFEMSTAPTEGGPAQNTILMALTRAGFINPDLLSNTWEKYSMHATTTFPETIWPDDKNDTKDNNTFLPKRQYILHARALAGAFASTQRGIYGGYVFDDNVGREIADKTLDSGKKFAPVAGKESTTKSGKRLVEMRVLDLTESGQYAVELHKPYLDFAFRCYWQYENGETLQNAAEMRAVNIWDTYFRKLTAIYDKYEVGTDANAGDGRWRAVGWKKAQQPELQKELAALIRKTSSELRHIVDEQIQHPESVPQSPDTPITILGTREIRVKKKENSLHDPLIFLSKDEAESLQMRDGQMYTMRFGEKRIPVCITIDESMNPDSLHMNQTLQDQLHIPKDIQLQLRFNPIEKELACGPLIGIPVCIEDPTLQNPFGEQTSYHKSLILEARKLGMVAYSFDVSSTTENFNPLEPKTIKGITLNKSGTKWIETTLPYPDVLLSRSFEAKNESKMAAIAHIPLVNHPEFVNIIADKLKLPEVVCENPVLKDHVPETIVFTGVADVKKMIEKHTTIYLKPKWGMRSEGVVRFDRLPDNRIRFTQTVQGTDPADTSYSWPAEGEEGFGGHIVNTIEEAMHQTDEFRKRFIYETYIVQEGIQGIPDNDGRPLELRFLFQRDRQGKPSIIGWDQGQKEYWLPTIERLLGKKNVEPLTTNAINLAKAISLQVQNHFGPHFGQYSIQIAIDKEGKTWLLEANPKPGVTNQFHAIGLDNVVDFASRQLLSHIANMSGFTSESESPTDITTVTLSDGSRAVVSEETNPFVIYQFAQEALKASITKRETSVYNLKTIQRIQENIANRTRYIMLRDENTGKALGCISILRPKSQKYFDLEQENTPLIDTKKRWEIGGVLTAPEARGKGIGSHLFEIAITQIAHLPVERDTYNGINIQEILVNVTGTYDWNHIGQARPDSFGIEKIVQNIPGSRPLHGAVPGSLGPIYIIPFTPTSQTQQ